MSVKRSANWAVSDPGAVDTDLIPSGAAVEVECLIISNSNASDRTATVQLTNGAGTVLGTLLPAVTITAGDSQTFDWSSFKVAPGNKIVVQASGADVDFVASGNILTQ